MTDLWTANWMRSWLAHSRAAPIAITVAVAILAFLNSIDGQFVYDDADTIPKNLWIRDPAYLIDIFTLGSWEFSGMVSNYFRPLVHVIWMLDYQLFGLDPRAYHLTSVLLHAAVSVLVLMIALRLFQPDSRQTLTQDPPSRHMLWPLIAALLFATHPIHSESVAWISGVTDVSLSLFYLLAFYLYMRADGRWGAAMALSACCFFLASLCKETALTLPIMLFAYDVVIRRDVSLSLQGIVRLLKRYMPFILVAFVYFAMRMNAINEFAPMQAHELPSIYVYFINIFPLFGQYLGKLVLPIDLNVYHVFQPISSLLSLKGLAGIAATLCYIGTCFRLAQTHRTLAFSLIWIAIPLLPVLYIPALGENTFTERYLYLPSVGFVMLLSATAELSTARFRTLSAARPLAIASLLLLVCLYTFGTVSRAPVWENNLTLWSDAANKSPNASTTHNNLASALFHEKRYKDAIEELNIAIRLKPDNAFAHYGLGAAYAKLNRINEAISEYGMAIKINPDDAAMHYHLGLAYAEKGLWDMSIDAYNKALGLDDKYFDAHLAMGVAYQKTGRTDRATSHFQQAIALNPNAADAYHHLGFSYMKKGLLDKAVTEFKKAIRINPDYALAHHNLGVTYGMKTDFDAATEELQTALRLHPGDAAIYFDLGVSYINMGKPGQAIHWLRQTLDLQPGHPGARELLRSLQAANYKYPIKP